MADTANDADDALDGVELTEYTTESAAPTEAHPQPTASTPGAATGRRKQAIARVRIVPGTGDFVIIVNASKVALTGAKAQQKKAYRHSGNPGGLKATSYTELLEKDPTKAVEKAVRGMLPKNSLARQQLSKLKVYAGESHPHAAQKPVPFQISQVAQ
ncbi:MAG: 50S ribosomal protein L13 [Dermatophilaceae bacterium]